MYILWNNVSVSCCLSLQLIEKLSALNPSGELKLKVMKEIAKEYQVEWDTTETETELLKPPEERIVCLSCLSSHKFSSFWYKLCSVSYFDIWFKRKLGRLTTKYWILTKCILSAIRVCSCSTKNSVLIPCGDAFSSFISFIDLWRHRPCSFMIP